MITTNNVLSVLLVALALVGDPLVEGGVAPGQYTITNSYLSMQLNGDISAADQYDGYHPRPYVTAIGAPITDALKWTISVSYGEYYMISSVLNGLCLDGNNHLDVPNKSPKYASPFFWGCVLQANNHQWSLVEPTPDSGQYMIINKDNGLALDWHVSAAPQHDPFHPAPFLWDPIPTQANHLWILTPVE